MSRKSWSAITFALLASAGFLPAGARAESLWVQNDNVNLLGGKGSIYPVVANVKKGQELTVVSREGSWVQVQVPNGPSGWVFESALSPKKTNADLFGGINREGAGLNTAAAARGLDPSTEQYAASKGMSKAPLEHLIALKKRIPPAEWEAFNRAVLVAAGMPAPPPPPAAPPGAQPPSPPASIQPQTPNYAPQQPQQTPRYTPQTPSYTPAPPPGGPR